MAYEAKQHEQEQCIDNLFDFFEEFDFLLYDECGKAGLDVFIKVCATGTRYYTVQGLVDEHRVSDHSKERKIRGERRVRRRDPVDDLADLVEILSFSIKTDRINELLAHRPAMSDKPTRLLVYWLKCELTV